MFKRNGVGLRIEPWNTSMLMGKEYDKHNVHTSQTLNFLVLFTRYLMKDIDTNSKMLIFLFFHQLSVVFIIGNYTYLHKHIYVIFLSFKICIGTGTSLDTNRFMRSIIGSCSHSIVDDYDITTLAMVMQNIGNLGMSKVEDRYAPSFQMSYRSQKQNKLLRDLLAYKESK